MTMDDLITFINKRLDERETAHRHAGEGLIAWLTYRRDDGELSHTTVAAGHHDGHWCADGKLLPEPASVLVIYDQAEALADIAAKRAIVARYQRGKDGDLPEWKAGRELIEAALAILLGVLRDLAAAWQDHPDYQAGWTQ